MLCKNPFNGFGCGQCTPCRINVRRVWSSRIMLEASLYSDTSFFTLTYDDDEVPLTPSGLLNLNPVHLQKFWKRFRIGVDRMNEDFGLDKQKIRFYAVGEYGDETQRPHYHAAVFNYSCAGKIQRPEDFPRCHCERCEFVRSSWGHGNITVDELNDTTASYIAGYVLKKMTTRDDLRLCGRFPEFSRMSKGIARDVVPDISAALRSEFGERAFQLGDVPASLNRGSSRIPLGRYLRTKIRQEIGLEKINPETGEVTYGAPHETLRSLQQVLEPEVSALHKAILDAPSGQKKPLYEKLDSVRVRSASRRKQRIKNLEAKHSINLSKGTKKL